MSRTLYLHIGSHKTGSTTIQAALDRLKDPRIFKTNHNPERGGNRTGGYGNTWISRKPETALTGAKISPLLPVAIASHNPKGDVIFSAEDLFWVFEPEEIQSLADVLRSVFDRVVVLVYLRRQDRAMISFYQEGLKWHQTRFSQFTGHGAKSLPDYQPHYDRYFDYNAHVGLWMDAFGKESVRAFCFGLIRQNEGLLQHFASQTHVTFKDYDMAKRVSHSRERQFINLRLVKFGQAVDLPRGPDWAMGTGEPMRPPRARALAFYQHFRESNVALNQKLHISSYEAIFDDEFDEYTEDGNETLDETAAEEIIDYMLRVINLQQDDNNNGN